MPARKRQNLLLPPAPVQNAAPPIENDILQMMLNGFQNKRNKFSPQSNAITDSVVASTQNPVQSYINRYKRSGFYQITPNTVPRSTS